jgi:hypothetical protein
MDVLQASYCEHSHKMRRFNENPPGKAKRPRIGGVRTREDPNDVSNRPHRAS